ncbi:MAG: hypothetical protein R8M45_00705 [Ghiorsea sp.]
MEYIQCTSCSKKYGVNDNIRAAVGRAIKCKACQDTFPIVIHDSEAVAEQPVQKTPASAANGGWDPSDTMPPAAAQQANKKDTVQQDNDDGDEELAALMLAKKKRKQRQQIYIASGLGVCLLAGLLFLGLMGDETSDAPTQTIQRTQPQQVKSEKVNDHDNETCRQVAAEQWMIDSTVMYGEYTAAEYVNLLTQSQDQSVTVRNTCNSDQIIQEILHAATKQFIPVWFEGEVHRLQGVEEPQPDPKVGSTDDAQTTPQLSDSAAERKSEH